MSVKDDQVTPLLYREDIKSYSKDLPIGIMLTKPNDVVYMSQ